MKLFKTFTAPVLLLVLVLLVFASGTAQAQDTRSFGLTALIQNGQAEILVPVWLGDALTLAPGFSLLYIENNTMEIGLLLMPRFYLDMQRVAPYISARGGVIFRMPDSSQQSDTTDLLLGIGFGGEYFVNAMVSFGVEAQLNGFVVDISGISDITLRTAAAVHANVYF